MGLRDDRAGKCPQIKQGRGTTQLRGAQPMPKKFLLSAVKMFFSEFSEEQFVQGFSPSTADNRFLELISSVRKDFSLYAIDSLTIYINFLFLVSQTLSLAFHFVM